MFRNGLGWLFGGADGAGEVGEGVVEGAGGAGPVVGRRNVWVLLGWREGLKGRIRC